MASRTETPFYQKLSFNLITLALICVALIYGKDLLLPLLFSILLANILLPVTKYLSRKKLNKVLSIFLPLLFSLLVVGGLIYFLSSQIMHFMEDVPVLHDRVNELTHSFQVWFRKATTITITSQNKYIGNAVEDLKTNAPGMVTDTFASLTGILAYAFLLPIYTFLILFYRSNIKTFLISVFDKSSEVNVSQILTGVTVVSQQYVTGLLIETTLVFVLNSIGFLILGIKYAIFLALLAALLNLIPYVGILVANVLCFLITLVSSQEMSTAIWVAAILALVQFLDNNFGMPLIVGNKVQINALVTIIGVLVGGAMCGIPGMFLAIPSLAVIKVVCDRVPELQPWGILLGGNPKKTNEALE
jgi:predicted PurR-regulated permease PerM